MNELLRIPKINVQKAGGQLASTNGSIILTNYRIVIHQGIPSIGVKGSRCMAGSSQF